MICEDCKHESYCDGKGRSSDNDCSLFTFEPRTRFQRITASPEKLAEFLCDTIPCDYCFMAMECDTRPDGERKIAEWLRQE